MADPESEQAIARLSDLLAGVAEALKGKPGPLASLTYHDLPQLAADVARVANQKSLLGKSPIAWQEGLVSGMRYALKHGLDALPAELQRAEQRLAQMTKETARR